MIVDDNHNNNNDRTDNNNMSDTIEMKSLDAASKKLDPTNANHITSRHPDLFNNNNNANNNNNGSPKATICNGKIKVESINSSNAGGNHSTGTTTSHDVAMSSSSNAVAQMEADSASSGANKKLTIGKRTVKRGNGAMPMCDSNVQLNCNR